MRGNSMKSLAKCLAALAVCSALVFGFAACANGSDGMSVVVPNNGTQNGGTGTPAVNPVVYTIILNANDGSPNPATVTQNFTAGVPQGLIPVEELGFSKSGFSFAGWGRAPKSTQSLYADGASYTATSNATLYALWSAIPVYSANIASSEHGTLAATPAAAPAGTEITLSASPNEGYELASYTVTAADGTPVAVSNGKFTMPAQDVTVSAVFNALNFTVTFNANDGSQSPATATQTFTAGTPQNLKTIAELGFSKNGFNFAGWLASIDVSEASYADGSVYTGTTDVTLYALWSAIPVYNVNTTLNERGTVTATPATGTAGTEITLFERPKTGYELASYTVTAADGTPVSVTNGKFAMPAQNVTVSANFNAINYSVSVGTINNGSVTANPTTATVGTEITLSNTPNSGYMFVSYTVTAADGTAVAVMDGKFTMPAQNVTVSATFNAISYTVTCGTFFNGNVEATPSTATVGTSVTLTVNPASGYELDTLAVIAEGGIPVSVSGRGNERTFIMPAKNVTVTATFNAINYNIHVETSANGSVTANPVTATIGTSVTLTISPASGYKLDVLAVTAEDGGSVLLSGTGNIRTFTMPEENVTVTATFVKIPAAAYTKAGTTTINGKKYDLVTFGLWPQTIKAANVEVSKECESKIVGDFTYYKGSDGQWYAEIKENGYEYRDYKYSDGTTVVKSSANSNSYKWFKVEPIKWRVLTTNYNGTGKKFFLSEKVLIAKPYHSIFPSYYHSSDIRKWLNSNTTTAVVSDHGDSGGFLKTAFTDAELETIVSVSVDNCSRSTSPDNLNIHTNEEREMWGAVNEHASNTPTTDKVFLLSVQEVTKCEYGFSEYYYNEGFVDGVTGRLRQSTDCAKASGVFEANALDENAWYAEWWLRSPSRGGSSPKCVSDVAAKGCVVLIGPHPNSVGGIVPGLCVEN